MYSLSTCWNSSRHTDGREMLREIRGMGFDYAELSHGIKTCLLPGIQQSVVGGEIKISSLHNFCPLPMGINYAAPNIYKFTALGKRERENALRYTLKTLETADKLKARAVVLHMGCIDMRDHTDKLLAMVEEGKRETDGYADLCESIVEERDRRKSDAEDLALEILDKLAEQAEKYGIVLGIENREALHEIPFEADFPPLLENYNRPGVGYWHDCGHAQIKEHLGFLNHAIFLEFMSPRLVGMHIHDVKYPGNDHCAPGTGTIDYAALKPMLKPDTVKVFELSPSLKAEEVRRGVDYIFQAWGRE